MAQRDGAAYRRRIDRGLARGLSRSQARGHPRAAEQYVSDKARTRAHIYDKELEAGVAALRKSKSLSAAAREAKVVPERLRRYLRDLDFINKERGRWTVGTDLRRRPVPIYTAGKRRTIIVQGYEPAALAGSYWAAVGKFLTTNDTAYLASFVGVQITDARGKSYTLETRPNVLYRLANEGGESFEQIYTLIQ